MSYSDKLRDPRWQKLRLEVMQRDKFTCLCCGDTESTLNVHHLIYHAEPWDSPLRELETLCEDCHLWREEFNKFAEGRTVLPTRTVYQLMVFASEVYGKSDFVSSLSFWWKKKKDCPPIEYEI